jgi:hypothetical protein
VPRQAAEPPFWEAPICVESGASSFRNPDPELRVLLPVGSVIPPDVPRVMTEPLIVLVLEKPGVPAPGFFLVEPTAQE